MKNPGDDKQLAATARTVSNSHELSTDAIKLAAVGISLIKETFPSNQTESEQAAELRLELFAELVEQVGEQRFVRAVRDTIKVSHRRWDCSVARVREMAGLKWTPPATSVAIAWQLVTRVFLDHCRVDADGNYRLEEKVVNVDGAARVTPVPEIPPAVKRAIQCLGGWAALAEAHPEFWGQRWNQFKEFYSEDTGLCVDSLALIERRDVGKREGK